MSPDLKRRRDAFVEILSKLLTPSSLKAMAEALDALLLLAEFEGNRTQLDKLLIRFDEERSKI